MKLNGYTKKYNQDDQVASFNVSRVQRVGYFDGNSTVTRFNDFRYDPYGQQVISSTGQIADDDKWVNEYGVLRDWNNSHYSDNSLQVIIRKTGAYLYDSYGKYADRVIRTYDTAKAEFRDSTFSVLDNNFSKVQWEGTQPFYISDATIQPLDAPLKSLSESLKLNPLDISPPSLPKLVDPSQIYRDTQTSSQDKSNITNQEYKKPIELNKLNSIELDEVQKHTVLDESKLYLENSDLIVGDRIKKLSQRDIIQLDQNGGESEYWSNICNAYSSSLSEGAECRNNNAKRIYGMSSEELEAKNQQLAKNLMSRIEYSFKNRAVDSDQTFLKSANDLILSIQTTTLLSEGEKMTTLQGLTLKFENNLQYSKDGATSYGRSSEYAPIIKESFIKYIIGTEKVRLKLSDTLKHKEMVMEGLLYESVAELALQDYKNAKNDIVMAALTLPVGEAQILARLLSGASRLKSIGLKAGIKLLPSTMGTVTKAVANDLLSGCRTNSFSSETLVRTAKGLVAISALSIGTPVLAYNEQTHANGYYPITDIITHGTKDQGVTYLTLKDPEQADKAELITTTPEHPFYLAAPIDTQPRPKPQGHDDLSTKWVGAGHLKIGDKIKQADGTTGTVTNVITVQQTQEMFNLTVDEAHTFYVGTNEWLVHNCGPISMAEGLAESTALRNALTVGNKKSFAYADINVTGLDGRMVGWSGKEIKSSTLINRAGVMVANNPTLELQNIKGMLDGERKLLDTLRSRLSPDAKGTINLFIDPPSKANSGYMGACQVCSDAILRFRSDFPGITLNVTSR
ncbi:YD repeat protein (plasmid) [Deinococcus gobiensis I-0]|uniref:YD repeat protein n=2 Tax=Deinococcus TaxID=1298 RepID=H8H3Z6_DEIGI|nr:YD repeat protein [Deinococcus gobiensis I-0]